MDQMLFESMMYTLAENKSRLVHDDIIQALNACSAVSAPVRVRNYSLDQPLVGSQREPGREKELDSRLSYLLHK